MSKQLTLKELLPELNANQFKLLSKYLVELLPEKYPTEVTDLAMGWNNAIDEVTDRQTNLNESEK